MKIRAKIKPNSKKGPLVLKKSDDIGDFFEVFVREPAIEGKANLAVINLLSKEFNLPKTKIKLQKGMKSKFKTFEINER